MSDTTPHNFDSQALSHQIAAALVTNHAIDPDIITYGTARVETRPGTNIYTGERTWCHIIDADAQTVTWNLIIDTDAKMFGTYVVDVANGEMDLAYITVDDAAAVLAGVLSAISYDTAQ